MNNQNPKLKFAPFAPDVWNALGALKRTGWVQRGVNKPETVQDHTISLINIANSISGSLSPEEKDGLTDILEVHDWPEAIHGDEVVLSDDENKLKLLKAIKFGNEKKAMASICEKIGEKGKEIMSLWLRYETSSDKAAQFAKQLDKYQAVELALEYQKTQGIPLFTEFLEHARKSITHPILVKRIESLEKEFALITKDK